MSGGFFLIGWEKVSFFFLQNMRVFNPKNLLTGAVKLDLWAVLSHSLSKSQLISSSFSRQKVKIIEVYLFLFYSFFFGKP